MKHMTFRSTCGCRPLDEESGIDHCMIIAEVAQAHDGSLGMAHAFVDAIADAGADAVKFQTHIAVAESTPAEPWRVKFSVQDMTRYDYWKRMEFSEEGWRGLKSHAIQRGLVFLSSPFSLEAMELLERVGVTVWKVASGEVGNSPMIDRMIGSGLPLIISSGMSPLSELDAVVRRLKDRGVQPFAMLQCTTAYPCPPEKIGLNMIPFLRDRYECAVGLSDHSGKIFPSLASAVMGVDVIEVHVTVSREMYGPDVAASITTGELRQLVEGVRFIETMSAHPVEKDMAAQEASPMRAIFSKSIVARVDLPVGTILLAEHLAFKKPGTGIPASRLPEVLGARLKRSLKADELLSERDLEETR